MVDERALKIAIDAIGDEHSAYDPEWMARTAIEAYEAARPDPWRPIEEASPDWRERILICMTVNLVPEISMAFPMDDAPTWCVLDGKGDFGETEIRHSRLIEMGAMFRTIDPPTHNLTSDHEPKESDDAA